MNHFFLQKCYKLKTQDSPFLLYWPPTWINSTAIVWEKQRLELTYWCIVEDRIIAWQTRLYYCNCWYWSTVLAQDGLTTEKNNCTTTQHEPFLPTKLFQTENTGLTPRSVFTSDKDEYQKQLWTEQTSEWQGFTMLYPWEVIAWLYQQLCAIKFAKTTCKSKWVLQYKVQVQIKDRRINVKILRGASTISYDLQKKSYTIHVIRSTCKLY